MGKIARNPMRNRMKKLKDAVQDAVDVEMTAFEAKERAKSQPDLRNLITKATFSDPSFSIARLAQELTGSQLIGTDGATKSNKSSKLHETNKKLTKKEKRIQKKVNLARTIMAIKKEKVEKLLVLKRQQTEVVGDMKLLRDALPSISDEKTKTKAVEVSTKPVKSFKQRRKALLEDISKFQQVLQHKQYQANPMETMMQHVQNKFGSG